MSLSSAELIRVVTELRQLIGARIQKVYVPGPRTAVLELRVPGQSHLLLLEAESGVGRLGIVRNRPPSPEHPIAIQGLWRNHLTGARLDALEVDSDRRVVQLRFATDEGQRSVVLEIAGRGGELAILDPQNAVLSSSTRERGLSRGRPYQPPDPAPKPDPRDRLPPSVDGSFPLSSALEGLYGQVTEERRFSSTRTQALSALRAARKRTARTLEKVEADRTRITEASQYQRLGDLLKPVIGRLKRGDLEAKAIEYGEHGAQEVMVPLLPNLSPKENMERYYHLHRRLARNAERVDERLLLLMTQVDRLDHLITAAETSQTADEVDSLLSQAHAEGLLRTERQTQARGGGESPRVPFREFRSTSGQRIWVGKNARDNDALTFRIARGNDLWLHARGQTGSHVIVPGIGASGPDGETLLDAATLAAHFSAARDESFVEVAATRRKHVHKPKGAAVGAVQFSQERTIALRREPDRLARLLASEGSLAPTEPLQ
jgi:predicted ribosome quality control (RQC) complex YloA/Tae2 family protein